MFKIPYRENRIGCESGRLSNRPGRVFLRMMEIGIVWRTLDGCKLRRDGTGRGIEGWFELDDKIFRAHYFINFTLNNLHALAEPSYAFPMRSTNGPAVRAHLITIQQERARGFFRHLVSPSTPPNSLHLKRLMNIFCLIYPISHNRRPRGYLYRGSHQAVD
jgi:hypothetical protein